jgi:hypothetical protein
MADEKKKLHPPQWLGRPILHDEHIQDLETRAALGEFHHKLPRGEAEARAHDDYVKEHRERAAAHHLAGMKASMATGNHEDARKHYAMYDLHLKALGKEAIGAVPPEVEKRMLEEHGSKPLYRFKAHKGDLYALHEPSKDVAPPQGQPIQKADDWEQREDQTGCTCNYWRQVSVTPKHLQQNVKHKDHCSAGKKPRVIDGGGETSEPKEDHLKVVKSPAGKFANKVIGEEAKPPKPLMNSEMAMAKSDRRERVYECGSCGTKKKATTNHTGTIHDHCEGCSWKGVQRKTSRGIDHDGPGPRQHKYVEDVKAVHSVDGGGEKTPPKTGHLRVVKSEAGQCKWKLGERRCQRKVSTPYCHDHVDHWANKIKQKEAREAPEELDKADWKPPTIAPIQPHEVPGGTTHLQAPQTHGTVEGFMGALKALPKGDPARGKLITQHMNHGPFLQALQSHPQGPQIHQMLTQHLNSRANAGFRPGQTQAVVKSEYQETRETALKLLEGIQEILQGLK